jgi:isopentenyl-diphosphate delta-isomerase
MDEIQDNHHSNGVDLTADSDALILVDAGDRRVGSLSKALCHEGRGVLHRAFSLLIFNGNGELLIQQRAASKRLWPLYWSNSCCSHPRAGESVEKATHRRLREELGLACPLEFLFKFEYQAQFDATGAEHELCSVFIGRSSNPVRINHDEILAWRWIGPEALDQELTAHGGQKFTPWFLMEWRRILRDHRDAVLALQSQN